jgi:hypothetical protein
MENPFTCISSSNIPIKDAIFSKMQQSKAILTCIMFAIEFVRDDMAIDNSTIYNALWAVDDCLENIGLLFERKRSANPILV